MDTDEIKLLISKGALSLELKEIAKKVLNSERITTEDALCLYNNAKLPYLGLLANYLKEKKHDKKVFFNRNFHIEPTNICIHNCKFCSYSRKFNQDGAWEYSLEEIEKQVKAFKDKNITEVHLVGGVHPHRDLHYYGKMIQMIKNILPNVYVKAFTAVEVDFMIKKTKFNLEEGLKALKKYGLDAMPGGGAEIFNEKLRKEICPDKATANEWLTIHKTAHQTGIPTNATMLYGHLESYEHRVDHLNRLRSLQDVTNGFGTFIPLKFRHENNELSHIKEVTQIEDLRNYAISRIFLDNFSHIKAYWVMIGKETAQMALYYGVDDIDGTIDDSTKIYTMAGSEEQSPSMTTDEIVHLIKDVNKVAVERDTMSNEVKVYH